MSQRELPYTNEGFGALGILAVIAVLVVVGGYVYHRDRKAKATTVSTTTTTKTSTSTVTNSTSTQQGYLVIKEFGIRLKLTPVISSAYYTVKSSGENDKPVIALYLHSLDSFPQCTPVDNSDGVAELAAYTPGQTDPVNGDFSSSYPNAPIIGGLHYYIANEQPDCSGGQNLEMASISQAFTAAYPTIEAYSAN